MPLFNNEVFTEKSVKLDTSYSLIIYPPEWIRNNCELFELEANLSFTTLDAGLGNTLVILSNELFTPAGISPAVVQGW